MIDFFILFGRREVRWHGGHTDELITSVRGSFSAISVNTRHADMYFVDKVFLYFHVGK
jgi:hypothetical protein